MGLIESLLGGLLGGGGAGAPAGTSGGGNALVQLALQVVQQNGGVAGILDKFRQSGLGTQADSWQSVGQNLPVSPEQIKQVLGGGGLSEAAGKLGVGDTQALKGLASILPKVLDGLTPNGQVPADQADLVSQGIAMLGRLGRR